MYLATVALFNDIYFIFLGIIIIQSQPAVNNYIIVYVFRLVGDNTTSSIIHVSTQMEKHNIIIL